ncbi:MAG: trypsin-like peptidase domain-containing protein, partial [Erysipelotrichaceae bacterium]
TCMDNDQRFNSDNETSQQTSYVEGEFQEVNGGKPIKKRSIRNFIKKHYTVCLLSGCLCISLVGGFGGTYIANYLQKDNGKVVMYQGSATSVSTNKTNSKNATNVAKNTMDSVVEITTESSKTSSFMEQYVEQGAGSGVILSSDGYIVTNHHVVNGATKISITTHNGKSYQAKIIGSDQQSDLALCKIDAKDLKPAILGDSEKLSIGDEAIAIGNPLGQGATLTTGVISALDRDMTIDGETMTLLQTNAAINPGNSGGGLFNASGELIGIVNAKTSGNNIEGLGFAIPINSAKVVVEELMKNGYVSNRAQLGVSLIDVDDAMTAMKAGVDEVGVYVSKIYANSAAEKGGLKIRDQIIQIGDTKIATSSEARSAIHKHKAGESINIKINRNGKNMDVKVTLDEASKADLQE